MPDKFVTATLDKFLGLYTEADPSSLPEGASPLTVNCDYDIGDVHQRPGKQTVYYFLNDFVEKNANFGQSVSDGPNETAWSSPQNITHDIPGTYASVRLNFTGGGGGVFAFDHAHPNGDSGNPPISNGTTPTESGELALAFNSTDGIAGVPTPGSWADFSNAAQLCYGSHLPSAAPINITQTVNPAAVWASILALFFTNGLTPAIVQANHVDSSGGLNATTTFTAPTTAGNTLIAFQSGRQSFPPSGQLVLTAVDSHGNNMPNFANAYTASTFMFGHDRQISCFVGLCEGGAGEGATVNGLSSAFDSSSWVIMEISGVQAAISTTNISEELQALNFGFTIPSTVNVLGFEVSVSGHQNSLVPAAKLTIKLLHPTLDSPTFQFQLPGSDGTVVFGSPTENWGLDLSPAVLNNPNFGVQIQAQALDGTTVTFDIYSVKIKAFLTPDPAPNFNYIKTYEEEGVFAFTLALDSSGTMWQEDVLNTPGALSAVYTAIEPNTFAQSATVAQREFIALSDLLEGTDVPYTYNGTNFDRCSQVGPGAAPSASTTTAASTIISITQNAAHALLTGSHDFLLISDSPRDQGSFGLPATPGNVLTIIFRSATPVPPEITPGSNVVLAGFPTANGFRINNDPTGVAAPKFYTVTSVGQPIPGQQSYDAFTVTVPFTTFFNPMTPGGCTYQSTTATMTTAAQVPNLEVGNTFAASGTGGAPPAGYDSSWTVLKTPNAAQLQITATSLTNNVATYSFNLISGTAPTTGQAVNVIQTLNGNGIFNVTNAIISSAGPGQFSIGIVNPGNIPSAAEDGAGIIFGTIFQFDAFQIIGNKTGGNVISTGLIAAGIRGLCYSFLTRNGYITAPSPILTIDITAGASAIAVGNLLPGPSNVVARIIHLTPANGGQFYNIPQPVPITDITGTTINSSTYVRDNTTTNVLLSFADGVLVTATEIDVQGNNLFETIELGSSVAFIPYGGRVFALGEENKITNLLNWSFDGGAIVVQSSAGAGGGPGINSTHPAGWNLDLTNGTGGSVGASPIFGFAYSISNTTGSTQAIWGMITQGAFQDEFQVPIINASTTYSVRVTAAVPTGPTTGALVVDLFSPSTGRVLGSFALNLATLATNMNIFKGTLLTQTLAPVPGDLVLRLYATSILNNVTVAVDRIEVFPTEEPVLATQLTGSYAGNFEAFDQNSGVINVSLQNPQPAKSAFTLYDNLYIVKSRSLLSTADNGTTEPNFWTTRVVSNVVGTTSVYGVDSGEDWAIIAGQPGLFIFEGGQPVKMSSEIQKLWNLINWKYGHTLWVKNDIVNQRILIGVPLKTQTPDRFGAMIQNPWLPAGVIADNANPTTPNVVLLVNYKQLNTGAELGDRISVHSSSFTGKLLATDTTRKWSLWSIQAPCAAFVSRPDTTQELFIGNSAFTGKIYQLVEDLLEDDGQAINQIYDTYGFVSPEQEQGLQLGAVQKQYIMMRMNIFGTGELTIKVLPNTLDGPYGHALLPNLILPASTNGDTEVPVNEAADRLFVQYSTNQVGAGFRLSKVAMSLLAHKYAPWRGRNS